LRPRPRGSIIGRRGGWRQAPRAGWPCKTVTWVRKSGLAPRQARRSVRFEG